MALKTDRSTLQTDISFFMNEAAKCGVRVVGKLRTEKIVRWNDFS